MAKVLKCDLSSGSDAYLQKTITTTAPLYASFRVAVPTATFTALLGASDSLTADFLDIGDVVGGTGDGIFMEGTGAINVATGWLCEQGGGVQQGSAAPDTWFDVSVHWDGTTMHWSVGGVEILTHTLSGALTGDWYFGGHLGFGVVGEVYYVDDFKAGTTLGGSDLFADNFEAGSPTGWDSSHGTVTVVDDPGFASSAPSLEGMVGIAFDDNTLTAAPTWTWIDLNPNLVATWSIDRGRSYELDQNDTGRATVTINDRDGILDPLNSSGTYYGKIEPLKQITLRRWNPVTLAWSTRYRGFIEDYDYTEHPSQHFMQLVISCVDGTEILSSIEMQPDAALFGTTPPAGAEGNVFYDNAEVDDRIIELYTDAGWPALLAVIFTGNVFVQETTYSAGETIWSAILEAADAEFPGVANVYFSRLGELTFHGRYARFDPVAVAASSGGSWVFTHWKCGDSAAVQASISDTAQIRGISFNRGLAKIINQARATPMFIARADVPGQVYADAPSAAVYGVRSWSADDLILEGGKVSNIGDNKAESLLYAQYYVDNFKAPKNRISQLVFKSLPPSDARAAPVWDLLCGVEISDMIDVHVRHPVGGTITGGFTGESFFVEGIHEVEEPSGSTSYNLTTVTLDVSPQGYYSGFPSAPVGGARARQTAAGKAGTVFHT